MLLSKHSLKPSAPAFDSNLAAVRSHLAEAMIGSTVDLLAGSKTIVHGAVAGVFIEAGKPKIVVGGHRYDVSQVLTVLPTSLN
jgi:hypothetical protein